MSSEVSFASESISLRLRGWSSIRIRTPLTEAEEHDRKDKRERAEEVKTADNQIPAPVTTAPQAPKVEEAVVAAAPEQGQINISNSNAIPTWKRQVVGLLERHKRYPEAAQARNQHGTVELAFSLDRQGRVTASRIAKSSGSSALDEATLDLVRRAQPFPAPPPEMASAEVNLSVPIRYNIR